jgi:hypothetical protein
MLFWMALAWGFRRAIPLATISGLAELLVGFSLLGVGLWTLQDQAAREGQSAREHGTVLGLGMLHGTAGAGHLFGVLPLLGLSVQGGVLYCTGFAAAGVASMAGVGLIMGQVARSAALSSRLRPICASLTLLVGFLWIANALLA